MKRLFSLFLVCLLALSGCASGPEPGLTEMLGTVEDAAYCSPFGFSVDLTDLEVRTAEELTDLNRLDGSDSLEDALTKEMDKGNAVAILLAGTADGRSALTLSLVPSDRLSGSLRTAGDYADYSVLQIPQKLEDAGCTNIQVTRTYVMLDETEHPAVSVSCDFTDGTAYHLLQICFREGSWMGGLSLTTLDSQEGLWELLGHLSSIH